MDALNAVIGWIVAHAAIVSVLLGLVSTGVVGFFTTCKWSSTAKTYFAGGIAILFGFVQAAMTGLDVRDGTVALLLVYGASQAFYLGVLKPAGVDVWFLEKFGLT